ncbi:MAG: glutaredoxin family protein [Betaproteobacteria bacterium]|nr:glutaredoxin family protein [Betaproteobacteria bacterium]
MTLCPKCNYVRSAQDSNPEWQCPSCHVAYCKVTDQVAINHSSAMDYVTSEPDPGLLRRLLSAPVLLLLVLGLAGYAYISHSGKPTAQAQALEAKVEAQVVLYSSLQCQNCRQVKEYFKANRIVYTEYNVDESIDYRRRLDAIGGKDVPTLFVKGERMDGFDQVRFEQLYRSALTIRG